MAGTRQGVSIPEDIALDPVQSAIWGEIAPEGRNGFSEQDIPNLRLLCYWHAVARQAQEAISSGGGRMGILERIGTKPYKSEGGASEPLMRKSPALAVLKDATAQVRALSDLLGISPRLRAASQAPAQPRSANAKILSMVLSDREAKASRAAGA